MPTTTTQIVVSGGWNFNDTEIKLKRLTPEIIREFEIIGEAAKTTMGSVIDKKTRRGGTGRLKGAIKVHRIKDTDGVGVGIGQISALPKYWFVINYGFRFDNKQRYYPPSIRGVFTDTPLGQPNPSLAGSGVGRGSFIRGGDQGGLDYFLTPRNPIPAFRYIEAGRKQIDFAFDRAINKKMKNL